MLGAWLAALALSVPLAAAGSEGASFLELPVGGRPAAMGGAYGPLASDAYAPVWNPAGLGRVRAAELAATHLSYLESMDYELLSGALPLGPVGVGASVRYLRPRDLRAFDAEGAPLGAYSGYFAAYTLGVGRAVDERLSLGASGKLLRARIDSDSASAWAGDAGALYALSSRSRLSLVAADLGGGLRFARDTDPLPASVRLGAAGEPHRRLGLSVEASHSRSAALSGRAGAEWRPLPALALRAGYRSDALRRNSPLAGLTTGLGLDLFGQSFDYAWVPMGDLGATQYFSLVLRLARKAGP